MKLNSVVSLPLGYDPPMPSGWPCGPADLAKLLAYDYAYQKKNVGDAARGGLSDEGFHRLLEIAYYTSMLTEEARALRFKLTTAAAFSVARFKRIALDSPEVLRRLAPACSQKECALQIVEEDGKIWCNGIRHVSSISAWLPGRPAPGSTGMGMGYEISVLDPGRLLATDTSSSHICSYELIGGNIRRFCQYSRVGPVQDLQADFANRAKAEIAQRADEAATGFFGGVLHVNPFFNMVSRMLRVAVEGRHGGAFVVLPIGTDPSERRIELKYPTTELDLGRNAVDFWLRCVENARNSEAGVNEISRFQRIDWTREQMLINAESVGYLSRVDGCVVLDRGLHVAGFGGVIGVADEEAKKVNRPFLDAKTRKEWPYEDFMKLIGGTRHRSAARLCRAFSGALVFIVSQDGNLTVLNSSEDHVSGYGPLDLPTLHDPSY